MREVETDGDGAGNPSEGCGSSYHAPKLADGAGNPSEDCGSSYHTPKLADRAYVMLLIDRKSVV